MIFIDGINYGITPKQIFVIIREHKLRLEKENYAPLTKKITIAIEEDKMLSLEERFNKSGEVTQNKFGWFIRLGGDILRQILWDTENELNSHSDFGYNFSGGFMASIKNKGAYWGMV